MCCTNLVTDWGAILTTDYYSYRMKAQNFVFIWKEDDSRDSYFSYVSQL